MVSMFGAKMNSGLENLYHEYYIDPPAIKARQEQETTKKDAHFCQRNYESMLVQFQRAFSSGEKCITVYPSSFCQLRGSCTTFPKEMTCAIDRLVASDSRIKATFVNAECVYCRICFNKE